MNIEKILTTKNETIINKYIIYDNKKKSKIVGYITYVISNNNCTITSINIIKPNKGYGTILLNEVIKDIKEYFSNIKQIDLDDMSDQFRKEHNIYIKFGFKYINDYGPEMELLL